MRKKILYISPHLSTGGLPQYLAKKIEYFRHSAEIYCVEYSFYGSDYVVQRNKIIEMLGNKFIPLYDRKEKLLDVISEISPDIIHFEEFCESFVDQEMLLKIFDNNRGYLIFETCHSSVTEIDSKIFRPDKFIMVSKWIADKFSRLDVPQEILEYPIENYTPSKYKSLEILGLDRSKKHVINVGLFTPGKNQGEIFEYARRMIDLPVMFHFVGNLAFNFKDYWEPLTLDVPKNCKIWGERNDVDLFYQAGDLFLFTSNFELNPLSIKEALSWKLPSLFKRLPTYLDSYDSNPLVGYLEENLEKNLDLIKKSLSL